VTGLRWLSWWGFGRLEFLWSHSVGEIDLSFVVSNQATCYSPFGLPSVGYRNYKRVSLRYPLALYVVPNTSFYAKPQQS